MEIKDLPPVFPGAWYVSTNKMAWKRPEKRKHDMEQNGGDAMIIFDYNDHSENPNSFGVQVRDERLESPVKDVHEVIFRNYPMLRIYNFRLRNCRFENCTYISLSDSMLTDCHMENVDTLGADDSQIVGCVMEHLRCDNDCLVSMEDSEICGCTFRDAEMRNGAHLICGINASRVESCVFEDCRTDRADMELIRGEEITGKWHLKSRPSNIVDRKSCVGLDEVKYIG